MLTSPTPLTPGLCKFKHDDHEQMLAIAKRGATLSRLGANFGATLSRLGANFGASLSRLGANFGASLRRFGANFGWIVMDWLGLC